MSHTALDHISRYQDGLSAIRRDIHAHPELGLGEYRTADLVARKPDAFTPAQLQRAFRVITEAAPDAERHWLQTGEGRRERPK